MLLIEKKHDSLPAFVIYIILNLQNENKTEIYKANHTSNAFL